MEDAEWEGGNAGNIGGNGWMVEVAMIPFHLSMYMAWRGQKWDKGAWIASRVLGMGHIRPVPVIYDHCSC
jgi:hypothetical protein